jgi:hypothetical protein
MPRKRALSWLFLSLISVSAGTFANATNLPFIPDDFAKARAQAAQHNLPIFIEIWAPW